MKSSQNSKSVCVWYLEPRTQNTNEQIAGLLGIDVTASEQRGVKCNDGKSRDMWEVGFSLVGKLFHSRHLGYFYVWRSQNGGLPSNITKTVANFFRPKISKSGQLKKGSDLLKVII